jgi:hypothetical protein
VATPIILDLGAPAGGQLWSIQQVNLSANDPFTSAAAAAASSVAASSGIVANAAATASLPAVAAKTNSIAGFQITGLGATGASTVLVTLTGVLGGTQTYEIAVPAGATTPITPLIVSFSTPLPATGPNVAITVSAAAFGAGNTNAEANIQGQLSGAGAVTGAIFVGGIPSVNAFNLDLSSMAASGLSVPGSYQAGGKSLVAFQGQHLYAALSGGTSGFNAFQATATVLEVPDTAEALLWL